MHSRYGTLSTVRYGINLQYGILALVYLQVRYGIAMDFYGYVVCQESGPVGRGLYTVEVAVAVGRQEECGGGRAPAVGGEPGALYILICLSHYTV
jgi:hypothetical protein